MPLEIVRNDITKMQVDVIVNTANPRAIVGGGVDRAIHHAAGPELIAARKKIGDIATGQAFITPAYKLNAKYVIHTVGPVWQDGQHNERELLARCYKNSLKLATEHTCESIAFPLISAGIFGCPAEIALATAIQAIREYIFEHDIEVYLVVFDANSFKISQSLFNDVKNYIDEVYVEAHLDHTRFNEYRCWEERKHLQRRSLDELLENVELTFSQTLIRLIDKKGKTDPEVYKRANVDKKLFSKIRNNPDYHPKKETALAFAVALELDLDETRDLIGRAGYTLSRSNKRDIVFEYFIGNKKYDIFTISEVLFGLDNKALGEA